MNMSGKPRFSFTLLGALSSMLWHPLHWGNKYGIINKVIVCYHCRAHDFPLFFECFVAITPKKLTVVIERQTLTVFIERQTLTVVIERQTLTVFIEADTDSGH